MSKQFELSLVFVSPLWLLYEVAAFLVNDGWLGGSRTGVDFLIKRLLSDLGLPPVFSILLPLAVFSFLLNRRRRRQISLTGRPALFAGVLLESIAYAVLFGVCVGSLTDYLLSATKQVDEQKVAKLVMGLGSGPYEEFIFRLMLLGGMMALWSRMFRSTPYVAAAISTIICSLLFAGFHYLAWFGDQWTLSSFMFRFFAGMVLSVLFLVRGFGVTAYTHSLYNVFLTFR